MSKDNINENEIFKEDDLLENEDVEDFKEIILTLDDDSELNCLVVAEYMIDDNNYIALLPVEDEEPGDILLYRAKYTDDEEFEVLMIEDEEEFELAADAYYKFIDENEIEFVDHDHDHGHDHNHHDHNNDD